MATAKEAALHIYFGSQTGRAESFAHELGKEALQLGILAKVVDLDAFSPATFASHRVVILVVANTGDGDPTDNAVAFHRWLMDPQTPHGALQGLHFAVFGLGDRTYLHFNRMGQQTDEGMERLGACRVYVRGIGDDSGDIAADFEAWKGGGLWPALDPLVGGSARGAAVGAAAALASPALDPELCWLDGGDCGGADEAQGSAADVLARFYFQASQTRVLRVQELRQRPCQSEGRSTAHVELDVSRSPDLPNYMPGGTVELLPASDPADVAAVLALLCGGPQGGGLQAADLGRRLTFRAAEGAGAEFGRPFPTPCTLGEALARYCDLRRPPSAGMLQAMRPRLGPAARGRLDRLLVDPAALRLLHEEALGWTQAEFWTALLGEDAGDGGRVDVGTFLLHCPRQRPRPFTVASSPLAAPGHIHLCASLVANCPAPLEEAVAELVKRGVFPAGAAAPRREGLRFGVCSQWLCGRLRPGDEVLVRIKPSSFRLPEADVPVVMVAAGAGIAPFRAFWQELAARPRRQVPTALFFGCRRSDEDWVYKEEMLAAAAQGSLSHLVTAFSREPGGGKYVQDRLRERAADLRAWLRDGGVLYVCGSTAMGEGVLAALAEILGGGHADVAALRSQGRIIQELWGGAPAPYQAGDARRLLDLHASTDGEPARKRRRTSSGVAAMEAEQVFQLIEARRSIFPKDYTGSAVDDEDVHRLLDAARWAPTHGKTEPWRFVVFAGEARHELLSATLEHYRRQGESDWQAQFQRDCTDRWLRCSHLVSICMRRQQPEPGKRLYPEHEEVAAVACAVQNMLLLATALRLGAYWSSWYEDFTASADGLLLHGLSPAEGDLWLGVLCLGRPRDGALSYRGARRPVRDVARWQRGPPRRQNLLGHSWRGGGAGAEPLKSLLRRPWPGEGPGPQRNLLGWSWSDLPHAVAGALLGTQAASRVSRSTVSDREVALSRCPDVPAEAVAQLLEARRSVFPKDYTGREVAESKVRRLLDAARWAPTHGQTEPWRFVVFAGEGRNHLIDATLAWYRSREASFWQEAWGGEFPAYADFEAHVERQRKQKWLRCSHLISICMRRQRPEAGGCRISEREEVAAVSCAVQNMHLAATALGLGAYWSSWFEHFVGSAEGVACHGLQPRAGDRWLGVFCVGESALAALPRASRRPVDEISSWRGSKVPPGAPVAPAAAAAPPPLQEQVTAATAEGAPAAPAPAAAAPPRQVAMPPQPRQAAVAVGPEVALQLIRARRSIFPKDYTGAAVPDTAVQQLLDVARWAPTHGKTEPWRFVVFSGEGRDRLIDATLEHYKARDPAFWRAAWDGEFADFTAFTGHLNTQRAAKWLRCSHLISICMRRQQPQPGKRHYPEHEEVAAVACAVQNMHLMATALRIGCYWSSWFEHFTSSADGLALHGLSAAEGDRWLGVFCVGRSERLNSYRGAARRPVEEIAAWQTQVAPETPDLERAAKRQKVGESVNGCPDASPESVRAWLEARRSIFPKDYTGAPVDDAVIRSLLDAARWAPTHGKTEPWRFVVFGGKGRSRLVDATLAYYRAQDATFWASAWDGEFSGFEAFEAHVERQRGEKWMRCSHLISICMRRQQSEPGKRLYPEHEEIAAVACAVQNMHLLAASMGVAAYWSSWFEHFVASPEGVEFNGLNPAEGDRWLGVFCVGQSDRMASYRATRRPTAEIASWRSE